MSANTQTRRKANSMAEVAAFGRLVKDLRVQCDLSQEALAERCDSAQVYISELERGRKEPCLQMIFRLANAFKMRPGEFLNRVEDEVRRAGSAS